MSRSPRLRRALAFQLAYSDIKREPPDRALNDGTDLRAFWHRCDIHKAYLCRRMEAGRGRWVQRVGRDYPFTDYVTWGEHRRGPKKNTGRRRSRP